VLVQPEAPDGQDGNDQCDGGADLIQLRAKSSTFDEVRRIAAAILPITNRAGVGLIINDHLQIALQTGTFGCHLGQEDFFDAGHTHVSEISAGGLPLIGLSTHAPELSNFQP
jgi:thiamine monophosphate synthase